MSAPVYVPSDAAMAAFAAQIELRLRELVTSEAPTAAAQISAASIEIADRAVRAAMNGRQDLLDEIAGQAQLLLEERRLIASAAGWAAVRSAVGMGAGLMAQLLRAGLLSLAVR
ncbi:MAG: hypothetical protein GC161_18460 [Planctomycetaceae bacterium]|nr:hypothetical protein [Planctomycetaceae bacterium]